MPIAHHSEAVRSDTDGCWEHKKGIFSRYIKQNTWRLLDQMQMDVGSIRRATSLVLIKHADIGVLQSECSFRTHQAFLRKTSHCDKFQYKKGTSFTSAVSML